MKEFVDYIASATGIGNKILLEKDIILHSLLMDLYNNDYFKNSCKTVV